MLLIKIFKVKFILWLTFMNWLQNHLITCPFKYITGIDCPGCGFQRSVLALLQGDFEDSFALYPPTIPILLAFIYLFADKRFTLDNSRNGVKKAVYLVVGSFMLISYCIKMYYKVSA